MIPKKALEEAAEWFLQVENFDSSLILENRLAAVMSGKMAVGGARRRRAVHRATGRADSDSRRRQCGCGGRRNGGRAGSMVATMSRGKKAYVQYERQLSDALARLAELREHFKAAIDADAELFNEVMAAFKKAKDHPEAQAEVAPPCERRRESGRLYQGSDPADHTMQIAARVRPEHPANARRRTDQSEQGSQGPFVLPAPLRPSTPKTPPDGTTRSRPSRANRLRPPWPYHLVTPAISTIALARGPTTSPAGRVVRAHRGYPSEADASPSTDARQISLLTPAAGAARSTRGGVLPHNVVGCLFASIRKRSAWATNGSSPPVEPRKSQPSTGTAASSATSSSNLCG